MDLHLSNIGHAPKTLPIWDAILDDLNHPPARQIAKALGVGTSTVHRWNSMQQAPRVACLALFWLTRWGRSQVDAQAVNDARAAVGLVRALTEERDTLRHRLAALEGRLQVHAKSPASVLGSAFAELLERAEVQRSGAFLEALGTGAAGVEKAQIETNWKVLLDPSTEPTRPNTAPTVRRYESGRLRATEASSIPAGAGRYAAGTSQDGAGSQVEDAQPAASVFGSIVAGVTGRPSGRASALDCPTPSAHARNAADGPPSLPLADQNDTRPGTPGSATGLRPSMAASGHQPRS